MPGRVVSGEDLERFVGTAVAVHDADATDSPAPPGGVFTRS
jgi:hypothetical protein